jgi:hypothetical protein
MVHLRHEVIPWIRDLGLVTNEEPSTGEQIFDLHIEDLLTEEDVSAHQAIFCADKRLDARLLSSSHRRPLRQWRNCYAFSAKRIISDLAIIFNQMSASWKEVQLTMSSMSTPKAECDPIALRATRS